MRTQHYLETSVSCSRCGNSMISSAKRGRSKPRIDPPVCLDCKILREDQLIDSSFWNLIRDRLWHLKLNKYKDLQPSEIEAIY